MIVAAPAWLQDFIDYLNGRALTSEPCYIHFIPDWGKAELSEAMETECVAVYQQDPRLMVVAGDVSEVADTEFDVRTLLMQNVAHEYVHHLQNVEGRLPRQKESDEATVQAIEDEAEGRAMLLVCEYYASIGRPIGFNPSTERGVELCRRYGVPVMIPAEP